MSLPIDRRYSDFALRDERDYYYAIKSTLSNERLHLSERIRLAENLFKSASDMGVWNLGELGCSVATYLKSLSNYRTDAQNLINKASMELHKPQETLHTTAAKVECLAPLEFKKEAITPQPRVSGLRFS